MPEEIDIYYGVSVIPTCPNPTRTRGGYIFRKGKETVVPVNHMTRAVSGDRWLNVRRIAPAQAAALLGRAPDRETLEGETIEALKTRAGEAGIDLGTAKKKAEIVDAILDHHAEPAKEETPGGDEDSADEDETPEEDTKE